MEQKEKDKYFADIEEAVLRDGVMIIEGMDEGLYHEFPALSSSDVKTWLGSSSQRKFELYLKFGKRATRAMEAGTVMHTVLLEGEKIWDRVVISPYDEFRTKEAKAWRDAQTKIVLKKNEADETYGKFFKVRNLVLADPATAALFRPDVLREVSIFVKHPTGIIKARFDLLDLENDAICDVKCRLPRHSDAPRFAT